MSTDDYLLNVPVYLSRVVYTRHRTQWNSKTKDSQKL